MLLITRALVISLPLASASTEELLLVWLKENILLSCYPWTSGSKYGRLALYGYFAPIHLADKAYEQHEQHDNV